MMRRFAFILSVLLFGCAPGLGTEVEVSALPPFDDAHLTQNLVGTRLNVRKFSDERTERQSIDMNQRKVTLTGDLGSLVQGAFVDAIKESGGSVCLFDCYTIEGDILDWAMHARPEFPTTKAYSRAKIAVRLLSPDGKELFHREYFGSMSGEHPFYTEDRLLQAFGTSMNEAILSAVGDPELARAIR